MPNQDIRYSIVFIMNIVGFSGAPRPHLQWTKVGGRLPDTHYVHNGVLRIDGVSESDSGTYKCLATTPVGRGEVTVQLHVLS